MLEGRKEVSFELGYPVGHSQKFVKIESGRFVMKRMQLFVVAATLLAVCSSLVAGPGTITKVQKAQSAEKATIFVPFVVTIGGKNGVIAIRGNDNKVLATQKFYVTKDYESHEVTSTKFESKNGDVLYKLGVNQLNKKGFSQINYFILDMADNGIHSTGVMK